MIIVSRIIHVKVDRRLNVTNKFKYQDDFQVVLLLSCFVGHPVPLRKSVHFVEDVHESNFYCIKIIFLEFNFNVFLLLLIFVKITFYHYLKNSSY